MPEKASANIFDSKRSVNDYDFYFNGVKIEGGGGITPTGTKNITENGTHNVYDYEYANVNVPQGITPTGTKNITENGTHNVYDYEYANVNVPQGITPTGTTNITENGTYDVTQYASAVVNVPQGGGGNYQSAYGTFTLENNMNLTTTPTVLPGLNLDFKPDVLFWMISRESFANLQDPSGNRVYGCVALKDSIMPYLQYASNAISEDLSNGYHIYLYYGAVANTASPNGYALDRPSNLGASYYNRFIINDDGTMSVGRYSSTSSNIPAGTYQYYAFKVTQ